MPQQHTFLSVDDIITPAMSEALNNSSSQVTSLQDTQMVTFIKWLQQEYLKAAYGKGDGGGWRHMLKSKPFKTYRQTTLNGPVSAGALTLTLLSATDWPQEGRSVIESAKGSLDFFDHESKASNVLTVSTEAGAEVIDMDHLTGEKVTRMYQFPDDFGKTVAMKLNTFPPFKEATEKRFPSFGEYLEYGNFFLLPRNTPAGELTLWYQKKGRAITARTGDGSTTDIPQDALRWAIEMTLFHVFKIRRKRGDLQTCLQLAEQYMQTLLMDDTMGDTSSMMQYQ